MTRMHAYSRNRDRLIDRLRYLGLERGIILELVWMLKSLLLADPEMDSTEANTRLASLGRSSVRLDDRTLELAAECFRTKGTGYDGIPGAAGGGAAGPPPRRRTSLTRTGTA